MVWYEQMTYIICSNSMTDSLSYGIPLLPVIAFNEVPRKNDGLTTDQRCNFLTSTVSPSNRASEPVTICVRFRAEGRYSLSIEALVGKHQVLNRPPSQEGLSGSYRIGQAFFLFLIDLAPLPKHYHLLPESACIASPRQ